MSKDLSELLISESYQRLLQIDPDDRDVVLDGTGSVYLIPTSAIRDWTDSIDNTVDSLGYITDEGIVFTTRPNTGSIDLKGNININGNINFFSGSTESVKINNNGYITFNSYDKDMSTLTEGTIVYKDGDLFLISN